MVSILCVGLAAGCGSKPQNTSAGQAGFQEKVRLFEADMRAQMQDLETRLEMLQGPGLRLSEEARELWLESSDTFAQARVDFQSALERAEGQTQATWLQYREELDQKWTAVEAAFQALKRAAGKRE